MLVKRVEEVVDVKRGVIGRNEGIKKQETGTKDLEEALTEVVMRTCHMCMH